MIARIDELRVIIAGGGTGGHVYPGIAMYNALKKLGERVEVLFVGATAGVEGRIFDELALPYVLLPGRGVRGKSIVAKMTSPFVLLASMIRAIRVILEFKPDVVVGTGGYASVSVVAAAIVCAKRRVLQEQNSVPGMANRLLSRFADLVLLSYGESRSFIPGGTSCAVVGNPLRIKPEGTRADAYRFFGLDENLPTVLVFGGSRGAHSINRVASEAAAGILEQHTVQFLFITGDQDYDDVTRRLGDRSDLVRVYRFLEEMQHAYAVADISVARAGASSVFELAAFGVPTVFVPYPFAADDHQELNVAELEKAGAALVVNNAKLEAKALEDIILSLLQDDQRRADMTKGMKRWAKVDADDAAARKIVELLRGSRLQHSNGLTPVVTPRSETTVSQL